MAEWKEYKLGDICDLLDCLHKTPKYSEDGFPMVRVTDVKNGYLETMNCLKVNEDVFNAFSKNYQPKNGDIVFTRVGSYGLSALVKRNERFCIGQNTSLIIPKKIYPKFAFYYLISSDARQQIDGLVGGSTQPTISMQSIRKIVFPFPPLSEQKAIASVLSSLDDKIDLLHRQNKTLEAMAETLFRQWFVEEAQEDWVDGKIPDEFDYVMGASPPGESYNEIGDGIPMFQGNADFGFRFPKKRIFTTDPKRFAEKLDTLISVRAPVGAQNMAIEKCCIGRGVAAFRYKKKLGYYTYTYFKLRSLMREIQAFNDIGTVFGSISKADFQEFEIVIPTDEIVDRYQIKVKPIDDKIILNTIQIRNLEKLRDTLLPKLMSGEVMVEL